ncbi:hypothetical protein A2U01_0099389, partial [Trifolium medium]|nr:hypothetical protein [Trifolium medium]
MLLMTCVGADLEVLCGLRVSFRWCGGGGLG